MVEKLQLQDQKHFTRENSQTLPTMDPSLFGWGFSVIVIKLERSNFAMIFFSRIFPGKIKSSLVQTPRAIALRRTTRWIISFSRGGKFTNFHPKIGRQKEKRALDIKREISAIEYLSSCIFFSNHLLAQNLQFESLRLCRKSQIHLQHPEGSKGVDVREAEAVWYKLPDVFTPGILFPKMMRLSGRRVCR